jgi:hypothetical protein
VDAAAVGDPGVGARVVRTIMVQTPRDVTASIATIVSTVIISVVIIATAIVAAAVAQPITEAYATQHPPWIPIVITVAIAAIVVPGITIVAISVVAIVAPVMIVSHAVVVTTAT